MANVACRKARAGREVGKVLVQGLAWLPDLRSDAREMVASRALPTRSSRD